jgi:tetratricopeptide (TPR) repeat protein
METKKQSPGGAEKKRDKFFLHLKNGRRFLQNNNLVEAKDELETALEFRPNDDKAQNLMAMVLFKLEQYPKAIGIFQKLIERNPGVPTLYTNLGLAYLKQESYDEAMEALLKAIEAQADNLVAHNYLGLVYSKLGRYEEARDEFVRANSPKMADLMQEKLAEMSEQQQEAPQMEEVVGGREEEMEEQKLLESQPEELPKKVVPVGEKEEISLDEITKKFTEVEEETPEEKRERAAPVEEAVKGPEEAIISLKDLSKSLEITRGAAPSLRMINDNLFQVVLRGGQVHARLTGLVAFEGDLIFEPEFKKFKGKETNAYFGTKDNLLVKITGEGQLLFSPENLKIHLFHLEDEMLYLDESAVFAFQEGINWENGRIHGEEERDVNLVQFRGRGIIALATKEKLASVQITSAHPLLVDLFSLTGWYGKILPKIIALSVPSEVKKGKKIMVELKGEGSVLLEESCKS